MSTWWEERTARVGQAVAVVAAQAGCSATEAMALLRERAEAAGSDLEDTALAVMANRISFTRRNSGLHV